MIFFHSIRFRREPIDSSDRAKTDLSILISALLSPREPGNTTFNHFKLSKCLAKFESFSAAENSLREIKL